MATGQSTAKAPDANEYGGDEISALVIDPGYSTVRAGFAGEDTPKSVVPSYYGTIPSENEPENQRKLYGDNAIHTPFPRLAISNVMSKDSLVEDWDTAASLWEYAITSKLTSTKQGRLAVNGLNDTDNQDLNMEIAEDGEKPVGENALLMTEPGWNVGKDREKGIEIAMENWGVPAFWLARSGVLAAFASGKPSALVVDIGAANISVSPVHDGMILRKGVVRSPLAGNFISNQARLLFSTSQPQVPLTPHYLISSKTAVDAGAQSQATYRTFPSGTEPDASFRALQEERVLKEFKESVVSVWTGQSRLSGHGPNGVTNLDAAKSHQGKPFEMPDGWNQMFAAPDRYRCVEGVFDAKMALTDAANPPPQQNQTIIEAIKQSLNNVDTDVKPTLLNHIVVTGGSSLIHGFNDRLVQEITAVFPSTRVRVSSPGNLAERKFGSWIGGSILASLGTFHQMWISRKEYEEFGAGIVEKRCK
ncbi:NuA4 histone acetyltransferase subunit [Bacidia gigantensis]|uniref:NuA4 histone acetyltransferase subunit n=1 Tax=Bacidia gigantensis TaxID=2732470 RepID=UPI001D047A82|nr:NuA4 histone acetyltransferase subunit [Bacidia gigantensis]KAG8532755.1 NuA4 histone acetyltransferase subunit [Bacidia gigantensis]